MKKIGLVCEKIRGQKIDVKNLGWKIDDFIKIVENFSDISIVFHKSFITAGITWHNEAHWHISGDNWAQQLRNLSFGSVNMTHNPSVSCIVSKHPCDSKLKYPQF